MSAKKTSVPLVLLCIVLTAGIKSFDINFKIYRMHSFTISLFNFNSSALVFCFYNRTTIAARWVILHTVAYSDIWTRIITQFHRCWYCLRDFKHQFSCIVRFWIISYIIYWFGIAWEIKAIRTTFLTLTSFCTWTSCDKECNKNFPENWGHSLLNPVHDPPIFEKIGQINKMNLQK